MAKDRTSKEVVYKGATDLARKLEKVKSRGERNRIMRPSVNFAITPWTKRAKQLVPVESGALKKSLGKKVKAYRGATVGVVGARADFRVEFEGKIRRPVKYAHLVELGTVKTAAKPFLRPAFQQTKADVVNRLGDKMAERIEKVLG